MNPHPRPAFTLIELLVVIAIVAILAAVAVPGLFMARQRGWTASCLSNLHQVGLALRMHVQDHEGRMPAWQNRASRADPVPAMDTELFRDQPGTRVFRCPADRPRLFETTGTSYFWNFTVNGQPLETMFSIIGGDNPTRIPLISDKEGFHPEVPDKVNILYADGHVAKELQFSTSLSGPP